MQHVAATCIVVAVIAAAAANCEAFKKAHALTFLSMRIAELSTGAQRHAFCIPADPAVVRSLQRALSPALSGPLVPEAAAAADAVTWWEDPGVVAKPASQSFVEDLVARSAMHALLWFTVVSRDPVKAKRAAAGTLRSHDIGLSIHSMVLPLDPVSKEAYISLEPVNMRADIAGERIEDMPLLFSPSMAPLPDLLRFGAWQIADKLIYIVDHAADPQIEHPPARPGVNVVLSLHKILQHLATSAEYMLLQDSPGKATLQWLLEHYAGQGVVHCDGSTGEDRWSLTAFGRARLVVGQKLQRVQALPQDRKHNSVDC